MQSRCRSQAEALKLPSSSRLAPCGSAQSASRATARAPSPAPSLGTGAWPSSGPPTNVARRARSSWRSERPRLGALPLSPSVATRASPCRTSAQTCSRRGVRPRQPSSCSRRRSRQGASAGDRVSPKPPISESSKSSRRHSARSQTGMCRADLRAGRAICSLCLSPSPRRDPRWRSPRQLERDADPLEKQRAEHQRLHHAEQQRGRRMRGSSACCHSRSHRQMKGVRMVCVMAQASSSLMASSPPQTVTDPHAGTQVLL